MKSTYTIKALGLLAAALISLLAACNKSNNEAAPALIGKWNCSVIHMRDTFLWEVDDKVNGSVFAHAFDENINYKFVFEDDPQQYYEAGSYSVGNFYHVIDEQDTLFTIPIGEAAVGVEHPWEKKDDKIIINSKDQQGNALNYEFDMLKLDNDSLVLQSLLSVSTDTTALKRQLIYRMYRD